MQRCRSENSSVYDRAAARLISHRVLKTVQQKHAAQCTRRSSAFCSVLRALCSQTTAFARTHARRVRSGRHHQQNMSEHARVPARGPPAKRRDLRRPYFRDQRGTAKRRGCWSQHGARSEIRRERESSHVDSGRRNGAGCRCVCICVHIYDTSSPAHRCQNYICEEYGSVYLPRTAQQ